MSDFAVRVIKRSAVLLALSAALLGGIASSAAALPGGFAWHIDQVTATSSQAGTPADVTVAVATEDDAQEQDLESLTLEWPDGLVPIADPAAYCAVSQDPDGDYSCTNPNARIVGEQELQVTVSGLGGWTIYADTYQDAPAPGEVARLVSIPYAIEPSWLPVPDAVSISPVFLRSDGSGINVELTDIPNTISFESLELPIHVHRIETAAFGTPESTGGPVSLTIPAICDPLSFDATFASYGVDGVPQTGDEVSVVDAEDFPINGCSDVPYNPQLDLSLSNSQAGARSNLNFSVNSNESDAATRDFKVNLTGLALAPTTQIPCTADEVAAAACPEHARLGTLTVSTPFSPAPLTGSIYLAYPREDAVGIEAFLAASFGSLRISGTLRQGTDGTIEFAFSDFPPLAGGTVTLDLGAAAEGMLQNPWTCGTHTATSVFTSHNARQVQHEHELVIGDCDRFAQSVPTKLVVTLTKPFANRHTDAKLQVTQQPRRIEAATFLLPKGLTVKRRQPRGTQLAYLELWGPEGVRRGTLLAEPRASGRLRLVAKNGQLRGLQAVVDEIAPRPGRHSHRGQPRITLTQIPGDEPLTDLSFRLFGRRTKLLRTLGRCNRSRNLTFRARISGSDGEQEASSGVHVQCHRRQTNGSPGHRIR